MKAIRFKSLEYQPASHEDPRNPGVLKKIFLTHKHLSRGRIQMINWAKLPPKKFFQQHYHEDMEEIFIIVTGKVKLTIDKETLILEKRDAVVIPCKKTHQMINIGNQSAEYIVIGISDLGSGRTIVV